jgi:hypothetical protein
LRSCAWNRWRRGEGAKRRLRAEALAKHVEAPAGLRRRVSLGVRASRIENQEPGTKNQEPRTKNREPRTENREPRAPWVRGRPEPRTKNREPRTTCPLGARASRTENQEPGTENHVHPGCAGVSPACGDCGLKPSLSTWKPLRGYGGERPWERGRLARMRRLRAEALAEHLEAPAGLWRRASLGARASRPHVRDPGACQERGRLARMRRLRAEALAEHLEAPAGLWRRASLGARASRPHTRNPERPWVRGRPRPHVQSSALSVVS